jgi:predicted secreted protein
MNSYHVSLQTHEVYKGKSKLRCELYEGRGIKTQTVHPLVLFNELEKGNLLKEGTLIFAQQAAKGSIDYIENRYKVYALKDGRKIPLKEIGFHTLHTNVSYVTIDTFFAGEHENIYFLWQDVMKAERIKVSEANNGSELELKKGQSLVITLEANPTTGYTWEVVEPEDEQVLQQVGGIEFEQESDLIGASGVQIIRFEVVNAGRAAVKLVYHRPWETGLEPLKTFAIQVFACGHL